MTTANGALTVIVDDSDTSRIAYSAGNWETGGKQGEFGHSTHGAMEAGALCTFTFNGTSVSVFGSVVSTLDSLGTVVSTYGLDNNPVQTFLTPILTSKEVQVPFYQSSTLADTLHTLVITAADHFWLDYILYTIVDPSSARPLAGSNNPSVSSIDSPVNPTSNPISTSSYLETQTSAKASSSPTLILDSPKPTGAILGGTLGGAALLLATVLLYLFFRRSKHQNNCMPKSDTGQCQGGVVPSRPSLRSAPDMPSVPLRQDSWIGHQPSFKPVIDTASHKDE